MVEASETEKLTAVTYLLQRDHTSQYFPHSSSIWGPDIQIYESILIPATIPSFPCVLGLLVTLSYTSGSAKITMWEKAGINIEQRSYSVL